MSDQVREIRINPIVPAESVLIATARGMRPKNAEEKAPRDDRAHVETCPFCRGNEAMTPPALFTTPDPDNWDIRIVENLYPVLGKPDEEILSQTIHLGMQQSIEGYGHHEVVIDHSNHGIRLYEMSLEHLHRLFITYRDRMTTLYENERIRFVLVFKNYGPEAGASIKHTHSQIIAMPVAPQNIQDEMTHATQHYQKHGSCIFCNLIDEALTFETTIYDRQSGQVRRKIDVGQFVISKNEHFIAIKPFASRFEWEVHILPLHHRHSYTHSSDEELESFAALTLETMHRLEHVVGDVQYNYFLHSAPPREAMPHIQEAFHWHLEIVPRTSIPTGFELGSGLFVNTINPEDAARQLREVQL
jgi:UDPglucose--hexose-1-phosphate uridylyltransferase